MIAVKSGFSTILIVIIAILVLAGIGGFVFLNQKAEKSETNDKKYFETKNGQSNEQKNNFFSSQEKHEISGRENLIPEKTPLGVSPLPPPSASKPLPIILPIPQQSIPEATPLAQPAEPIYSPQTSQFPNPSQIAEFSSWANSRGITLQAVSATVDDIYYNRYAPAAHNISLEKISGLMTAHYALKNLPAFILDTMRGKTIYFSTSNERPYTNLTGDYGGTLKNTKAGFILTQPISEDATLHELGHIVGYHGIEGLYGFAAPFADLKKEYDELFDTTGVAYPPLETPKGYISSYAAANKAENFAEHFSNYVFRAGNFNTKMAGDTLLTKKYDFFDKKLFLPAQNRGSVAKTNCQSNTSPIFTNHITDISKVSYIVPPPTMGSGPSLKTHSYIGTNGQRVPVLAPTDIVLKAGSHSVGGPYSLEFQVSCEVNIRFGHITDPVDSIKNLLPKEPQQTSQTQEVSPVYFKAGDLIGYTTGTTAAGNWDFGAYDSSKNNRYISDPDWNWSDTYTKAVCPFDYFSPNLKSQYYSRFNSQMLGGNPPHGEPFCQQ